MDSKPPTPRKDALARPTISRKARRTDVTVVKEAPVAAPTEAPVLAEAPVLTEVPVEIKPKKKKEPKVKEVEKDMGKTQPVQVIEAAETTNVEDLKEEAATEAVVRVMREYPNEKDLAEMSPTERAAAIVDYFQQQAGNAGEVLQQEIDEITQKADFFANKDFKRGMFWQSKAVREAQDEVNQARKEFNAWTKARDKDYKNVGIDDDLPKFNSRLELMRRIEGGETDISSAEMQNLIALAGIIEPDNAMVIQKAIRQAIPDDIKFRVFMATEWENYSDGLRTIKIKGKEVRVTGRKEFEEKRTNAEKRLNEASNKQDEYFQKEAEILQQGGNLKQAEKEYLQTMDTLRQISEYLTQFGGFVPIEGELVSELMQLDVNRQELSRLKSAADLTASYGGLGGKANKARENLVQQVSDGENRVRGMELPEIRLIRFVGLPDALRRAEVYIQMGERDNKVWQDTPYDARMAVLRVVDVLHGREPRRVDVKVLEVNPAPEPPKEPILTNEPEPIIEIAEKPVPSTFSSEQIAALPAGERARYIVGGEFTAVQLAGLEEDVNVDKAIDGYLKLMQAGHAFDLDLQKAIDAKAGSGGVPPESFYRMAQAVGRSLGELWQYTDIAGLPMKNPIVLKRFLSNRVSEKPILIKRGDTSLHYDSMLIVLGLHIKSSEKK